MFYIEHLSYLFQEKFHNEPVIKNENKMQGKEI